jgi:hypothetical protein
MPKRPVERATRSHFDRWSRLIRCCQFPKMSHFRLGPLFQEFPRRLHRCPHHLQIHKFLMQKKLHFHHCRRYRRYPRLLKRFPRIHQSLLLQSIQKNLHLHHYLRYRRYPRLLWRLHRIHQSLPMRRRQRLSHFRHCHRCHQYLSFPRHLHQHLPTHQKPMRYCRCQKSRLHCHPPRRCRQPPWRLSQHHHYRLRQLKQ